METQVILKDRKPYSKPEILHEIELETRAGSPLGSPDVLPDLLKPPTN